MVSSLQLYHVTPSMDETGMLKQYARILSSLHACLIAAVLVLSGCASGGSDDSLVVGILSEPKTLNPLSASSIQSQDIVNLIFLELLVEDGDFLNFQPSLAERWTFGSDSLSITFALRKNARWHDGKPVTAADVRFTYQLQTDTLVSWASRSLKNRITDVEVVDAHTVTFHFANRYPDQLRDANDGVILPRHLLEGIPRESLGTSDFGREPIGSGPYMFARWLPGQLIELERNPQYYVEGQPYVKRVVFRIVPDMTNLVTQLKTGEIDCLESIPTDALPELRSQYPDVKIYHYMSRAMSFVVWNLDKDLFSDPQTRRALAMAINGPEIIETLWGGMATALNGPMHPMLWAHDPGIGAVPYDPDRARSILADRGWTDTDGDGVLDRDGRPFEFDMTANQGVQLRADIMTMVQEYLRRVGVRVNARILEWNAFIGRVVSGEFDSCVLGWKVSTRADLTSFWHSTSTPPAGFNASRYNSPRADQLMEKAKNTLDVDDARSMWHECQRIIYDDQPLFFLAVPYEVVGLQSRFCNVKPNAHGFFVNLPEWHVDRNCDS